MAATAKYWMLWIAESGRFDAQVRFCLPKKILRYTVDVKRFVRETDSSLLVAGKYENGPELPLLAATGQSKRT